MSKVEVEYTRTRKRKYIQKQYADILERLGLVKRVLPEARPQQKVQSRRTISGSGDLRSGPATAGIPVADALQDAKVELQVQTATKGSIKPGKKKRVYKRRDLESE